MGSRGGGRPLAVDLGTANTVVFRRGDGIVLFEPSVVAVDEITGKVEAVGADARRMIGRTPAHIRATRPLRHGVITDYTTTAQMLRHFIRRGSARGAGRPDVIVCVPGGVTQVERSAVEEATLSAGAAHAFLIDEPLAAAIGAGLPIADAVGSLVVDVGGGTTEMAVTALGGLVVSDSLRVGGYDLDDAIVRLLQQQERLLIGQEQAEVVKFEIGAAVRPGDGKGLTALVRGRDVGRGMPGEIELTQSQVADALAEPVNQIVEVVRTALEHTQPEIAADVIDQGITMTGGGSLLREFATVLQDATGLPVHVADDPMSCVALGAGRTLEDQVYRGALIAA